MSRFRVLILCLFALIPSTVFAQATSVSEMDTDADGISDSWEILLKTDPKKADSDGDGFSDAVEVRTGFSPVEKKKVFGSYSDQERDGLDNRLEWLFETDPYNPDSDADGKKDGEEILAGLSPTTSSTDLLSKEIHISLALQTLERKLDGKILSRDLISSGVKKMPTPKGTFTILNKNPRAWSRVGKLWMPWWMSISEKGYGLHELPEWPGGRKEGLTSLGHPASHGCVRLGIGPAKRLYDWTPIGTTVTIE